MQCSSNRALRRANFDSASLHLSRGLAPYGKEKEIPEECSTLPQEDSAVPTSIPLRSISVAGWRPMEKQKRPAGRMRALFPRALRRANFDSAPLHLSRGLPMEKQKRRMRALFPLRRANFDSAPLHLSRGLAPYGKAETTSRKNASTLPQEDSAVPTSIPLRSISVAGWRPMEKQKRPAGRMQALFHKRTPPCQLRFRFAPSQSRAGALWKSRNDQPEECKHSSGWSFLLFRTAQCHHESSSFPVYS